MRRCADQGTALVGHFLLESRMLVPPALIQGRVGAACVSPRSPLCLCLGQPGQQFLQGISQRERDGRRVNDPQQVR
jgi:hypothetical protein